MRVATAQLPGPDESADRVFVVENAVIVLDGASAFEPVDLAPGEYAQSLGQAIAAQLAEAPHAELPAVVAEAIAEVAAKHDLRPGASPSSTVSILRVGESEIDLFALGDSPIYYGDGVYQRALTDERLTALQLPDRDAYRSRLRAGHGYDDEHRRLLGQLQRKQRQHRNRDSGYWIAEAEPQAAHQARTASLPTGAIAWAVLATDGASDVFEHLGRRAWPDVARGCGDLDALLRELYGWEEHADPEAIHLPRAKRHDDKTIAAVQLSPQVAAIKG